jgi:hypothetical protein
MKGENTSAKKIGKMTEKMKIFFEWGRDLQMQDDGVNLFPLSKKITHSRARMGLAGRSIAKYEVPSTKYEVGM